MKIQKNHLEGLIALLLFGVFAVCLLIVLLTGADAYHNLTEADQTAYEQYITTQVRQADAADSVSIVDFGDGDALSLAHDFDGDTYFTLIYYDEGYLKELFCSDRNEMAPADGEIIMPIHGLTLSIHDQILRIDWVHEDDTPSFMQLTLRSGKEVGYEE